MIVYSDLTTVMCLEMSFVLTFLFLAMLKERKNPILVEFCGLLMSVFQKWS